MNPATKTLVLYIGDPDSEEGQKAVLTVTADALEVYRKSCVLHDAEGHQVCVITWPKQLSVRTL